VSTVAHRGARRAAPHRRRSSRLTVLAIAFAAVAVVGTLIVLQARGGGAQTIPPRVAVGDGRVLGDENAPVTVVEYADFQCPICKHAETSVVSQIERDYVTSGQVKIEFRMFPFLGQDSFNAAQAAEAARDQGKFWEYHDALYNAQGVENSGAFSYDKLVALAQKIGLDVPAFEAALSGNVHLADVQKEADTARSSGVSSTPTFFIGDKKIVGAQPYGEFQSAIDAALMAVK